MYSQNLGNILWSFLVKDDMRRCKTDYRTSIPLSRWLSEIRLQLNWDCQEPELTIPYFRRLAWCGAAWWRMVERRQQEVSLAWGAWEVSTTGWLWWQNIWHRTAPDSHSSGRRWTQVRLSVDISLSHSVLQWGLRALQPPWRASVEM